MKQFIFLIIIFAYPVFAQDTTESTNSFFDDSSAKTFSLDRIMVEGEVEHPGPVKLAPLPLHRVPIKEALPEQGKLTFKGAFFYSGYTLFDILNRQTLKKTNQKEFRPKVDCYIIVENEKGEKAVFSWGEIYYSKDNFKIIISKSVSAINPSKLKAKWPLPEEPRLICGNDLNNSRCISSPTKITVKSFTGIFASEKPKVIYSPEIQFVYGSQSVRIGEIGVSTENRKIIHVGYGHGMGFKGVQSISGYTLKSIMRDTLNFENEDLKRSIAVVSAKDGYRAVFSISEILNRNDNDDFLVIDKKDAPGDGRYALFATPDFFVDRNVRAIEKIEIVRIQ